MNKMKEILDGVEVVSSGEEEKPSSRSAPAQRLQPTPPPQQPIQSVKSSSSSSRSRVSRNSSLSELHADDIIKQLTMNAD